MKKFFLFILVFTTSSVYPQTDLDGLEKELEQKDKKQEFDENLASNLSLQDAIDEGLRENFHQLTRKYQFELNEIVFKDAHDDYFYPKLNLTMGLTSDHFVENFYRDNNVNASSPKTPTGYFGLELEDYTLFNWGKDYMDYLNSKDLYQRAKQNLSEDKRELRYQIIQHYFDLSTKYLLVRVQKRQLSHTSFIYRLAKEKLSLRKINSQEYLQAKTLFLEAHKNYQDALFIYYKSQETMATLLGDDLTTTYKPLNVLRYKPVTLSSKEAYAFIKKNNRQVLDAKTQVKVNSRLYQKALKDNLPLPKLSLKLGSYYRTFSNTGYSDEYNTFANSKNLEVAATVNMTWRLLGRGGLFNSRINESAYYHKKMSELQLRESHRNAEVSGHLTHGRILHLQKKFEAADAGLKNARKVFDKAIDNYLASKTSFANIKQILQHLQDASTNYHNTKYEHLAEKIQLARIMGVDDFPGERFDRLIEQ